MEGLTIGFDGTQSERNRGDCNLISQEIEICVWIRIGAKGKKSWFIYREGPSGRFWRSGRQSRI